ncbi:MAG: hypothetical protein J0L82_14540 [Deltaproteobacteria bacterium]|nr:hypothetical protein [Deltaproteobacteria bacterium]
MSLLAYNSEFKAVIQLNIQSPGFQKTLLRAFPTAGIALLVYVAFGITSRVIEDLLNRFGIGSSSESAEFQSLAIAAFVTLIWTLFSSGAQLTYLAKRLFPGAPAFQSQSAITVINLIAIENTRSLSACILRIPLLVVPAVIEWFRLLPVPYIVLLDPDYNLGKVDVLKASRRFFSDNKILVLGLTIPLIIGFAVELVISDSPIDSLPVWEAPFQHIGSISIVAAIRLLFDFVVLWAYRQRMGPYSAIES